MKEDIAHIQRIQKEINQFYIKSVVLFNLKFRDSFFVKLSLLQHPQYFSYSKNVLKLFLN